MAFSHHFKPNHKDVKRYHDELADYATQAVTHEGATSTAFQNLLAATCKKADWHLVPQLATKIRGRQVRPDGTLRDDFNLHRGYWEAKDTADKLDAEIRKKIALGYPLSNTIFEDTATAILFQNGAETEPRYDLAKAQDLCDLLNKFYSHTEPDIEGFEQAVDEFKARVPELAQAVDKKIKDAHKNNKAFQAAFETFFDLCRQSLNPNLSEAAVDEMLIQHLLTIRLFDTIFDNPDFVRRNVIAAEVEKVIDALTSKSFSRESFLKSLDRFYVAIESASRVLGEDFTEKQHFLNTVYERFFQGYSVDVADTHGIVYTPQEIVDFMCASVAEVLEKEFGKTLGSKDINILDPCTGTGNFIVNLVRRVPKRNLARVYQEQLFANEVMLLPYYIAALNIEHAFYELTGEYEAFEGLCFVDTLDLTEMKQQEFGFMTERNTERVERQKATPITVIIGNPPYNVGQINENDNNKNRKYAAVDKRIQQTFVKDSEATLNTKLYDAYVRFFRWAIDRLEGRDGIVCFVSNSGFIDQIAFDGVRMHLAEEFNHLYLLDLKGNVRKDSMRDRIPIGEMHTVFGLAAMVGISVNVFVRKSSSKKCSINYFDVDWKSTRAEKFAMLRARASIGKIDWRKITPDSRHTWLVPENADAFEHFVELASKATKMGRAGANSIFCSYSLGVSTNRDIVAYNRDSQNLASTVEAFCDDYNAELSRFERKGKAKDLDTFLDYSKIKWSRNLKRSLRNFQNLTYDGSSIRTALYRPFSTRCLYFGEMVADEMGQFPVYFPTGDTEAENRVIACSHIGFRATAFSALVSDRIVDLHLCATTDGHQCFPFYVYNDDGTNRRENITDWALQLFRDHYKDKKITKWDVFYYVYGLLHHPGYRTKFADNLKRELPRIPLAPDFKAFAKAGKKLADLHLEYEELEPWPLKWLETDGVPLSYYVEKMRLSKDKTQLKVNESLTLAKIPPEVFDYRLGNRSALDWVIDQYRISTDKRSGITSDPNNPDDPEYIVRLIGQVVRVSVETVKIVTAMPSEYSEARPR
jgi:predicted helicase